MDNIKESFKHDYNEAIENYNGGDYVLFFRNMRPAIEGFCKLVIYDLVDKCLAEDLLFGRKSLLDIDYQKCSTDFGEPTNKPVQNSMLPSLAKKVIYYQKGKMFASYKSQQNINRKKNVVDSDFKKLASDFGNCSGAGSHTGEIDMDKEIEARNLVTFMPKIFSDLETILTNDMMDFLHSLNVPSQNVVFQNPTSEHALKMHNEFLEFDEKTNYLAQSAGTNYVVILPDSIGSNGVVPTKEQLADFFRVHWNFIIDLDPKTENGLYENAPSEVKSATHIITDNLSEISGSSNITNWLFGKGRVDLNVFDDRKALRETPKLFASTFAKLVKTGNTTDYMIIDFCDNFPKLALKMYDRLDTIFGDWDVVATRCKIISFTTDDSYREQLTELSEDYGVSVSFMSASFLEFLDHVREIKATMPTDMGRKVLIHNNTLDLTEARERYIAAGIEFYGPSKTSTEERKWDFYSGAEITWDELDNQYDVTRDIYHQLKERIFQLINTIKKTTIFTLRHLPGSGATTLARRLAFDIRKQDEIGALSCTAINIKKCDNLTHTESYLSQLSEKTENVVILAVVESKHVAKDKFNKLVQRMTIQSKRVLFFYVEPYTRIDIGKNENLYYLDSKLSKSELLRFENKYFSLGLKKTLYEEAVNKSKNLEVVDFPLMLKDNQTSDELSSYVSEWMAVLTDNLRKFCAYVAFAFKYSDLGVNQMILKPLWKDKDHWSPYSYGQEQQTAISKLLIEETTEDAEPTGIWRPRYNRFSEFILEAYKNKWKLSVSEIAKDFIQLCKNAGELGSDDKDMLYSIFVIRKNADYHDIEDEGKNIRNKFSLLIRDLDDNERAESLFKTLVDAFPEDAIFRGHYARFLYEKASLNVVPVDDRLYSDAQHHLNIAFDLNPDDADLYHMQGMLIRRKIRSLENTFQKDVSESVNEDLQEVEDCLHSLTQQAYDSFERSIQLSPASPYGYAAESQLFKESISFGRKILGYEDFAFCEKDSTFSEYTEKLGNVLDSFEQVCYAFKDDGLVQIMSSYKIYESVRLFYQNIIGQNKEAIQRFRTKYRSASDEKKIFYGNLLRRSILYTKTDKKDYRRAYSNLTKSERSEIENILEYQKNHGDIKSYDSLFLLKLYGPEEFSLDEAIDFLKEWERRFTDGNYHGWGYLNACFYLAVCYCAKSIQAGVPNKELSLLAKRYFEKSENIAKEFDKGTMQPLCYLGEKEDIHCIIDRDVKNYARTVSGVIQHIKGNKGIMKMSCGIEVSFGANKNYSDKLKNEGKALRGILGFRYSGPGLYEFRPDDDNNLKDRYEEIPDEKEKTFEELDKEYLPPEDLVEEKEGNEEERPTINIKQVGYLSPEKLFLKNNSSKRGLVDGQDYEGKIIQKGRYKMIDSKNYPYSLRIEDKNTDFYEDEVVIFTAKSRPNDHDANKLYWYATNVRLKED